MYYRKDIDGLRSVAVLLVMLYHFGFHSLSGGFIGVDVFFVISGFLITNIIFSHHQNFDFIGFYARRVRRLLPALFSVLIVSFGFATLILLPSDYINFAKSIIWINIYLANVFFWRENGGYFEDGAEESPLIHTWSLAVEEQFYFIWPLFILAGLRLFGARWFGILSIGILLVTIYLSQLITEMTLGAAYYLLPSRAFELMIGAVLALLWKRIPTPSNVPSHLISISGLGLIIYSSFFLSEHDPFPGYNAIPPTLGTALLIFSGKNPAALINRLLSLRPFVFTGLISYSLYLWHWPITAYVRYTGTPFDLPVQAAMIGSSFVLAYLNWKYIEIPFRDKNHLTHKQTFARLYLAPAITLSALAMVVVMNGGFPHRFSDQVISMDQAFHTYSSELRGSCHSALLYSRDLPNDACQLGETNADNMKGKAFMLGDSHANHYTGFMDEIGQQYGILINDYTMDRCPPLFDTYWGTNLHKAKRCKERNDQAKAYLFDPNNQFTHVILAASWPTVNSDLLHSSTNAITDKSERARVLEQKLHDTLSTITDHGMIPILLRDSPMLVGVKAKCPLKRQVFKQPQECDTQSYPNTFMDRVVPILQQQFPQLVVIDPRAILCQNGICKSEMDGLPMYRDLDHLNDVASRRLGQIYMEQNQLPLFTK